MREPDVIPSRELDWNRNGLLWAAYHGRRIEETLLLPLIFGVYMTRQLRYDYGDFKHNTATSSSSPASRAILLPTLPPFICAYLLLAVRDTVACFLPV